MDVGPTSSDIANSTANDAQRSAADHAVLIDWLIARVDQLEALLCVDEIARPETPSERTRRRHLEFVQQQREAGWPPSAWLGAGILRP
jgi:hypothetical protein